MSRVDEIGLEFTTDSMAEALKACRHEDIEIFLDKDGSWTVRYWFNPDADEEEQWGAVHRASTLHEVLAEATHGVWFS